MKEYIIKFDYGNVDKITSFGNSIKLYASDSFLEFEDKDKGIQGLVSSFKDDSINWNQLSEHIRKDLESLVL